VRVGPPPPEIGFRPVLEKEDWAFLLQVYSSTREQELAAVPWTPEQKAAFLEQQFSAQDRHYRAHYLGAEFLVILIDGRDAGRLYVYRSPAELRVMDIALLPGEQRKGVGGRILSSLVAEADREGRSVCLHVERENPAMRLYARLGFRVDAEVGAYLRLVRQPALIGSASSS
jgi:GNAT superfamily N-acetyltransferase